MLDIAHRGASGVAPENTLPAFDLALDCGADGLELDVHMTRDGVLVVVHDATLERIAGRPDFVADMSLRELQQIDAGAWFGGFAGPSIPTLDEVFHRYRGRTRYFVELKDPELYVGIEAELLRLVHEHRLGGRVVVQSFSSASLQTVAAQVPVVRLYPEGVPIATTLDETAAYAYGIGPCASDVDRELVRRAHARALAVFVYTVDSPDERASLAAAGIDGIFTDFPGHLALTTAAALP